MAANEETVSIDTVKKTLWDSLEALGENISGETLTALMEIIEGGGSGGGVVYVPFTVTLDQQTEEPVATTTANFSDVAAALQNGKGIVAKVDFLGTVTLFMSATSAIPSVASPGILSFSGVADMGDEEKHEPGLMTIQFGDTGNCNISLLPLATE